ncbi:hypothetical protein B0H17DRAFT_1140125 [Mycena rosella]|uniref:Uncharacterized protein n=1 Tax=Mycena rosella TaxID=1033263 RepID=A0AAD7D2R0_MYCRO|nr:hypothetical protein B0H17DRAFT_1140125 [Mycena rosella]
MNEQHMQQHISLRPIDASVHGITIRLMLKKIGKSAWPVWGFRTIGGPIHRGDILNRRRNTHAVAYSNHKNNFRSLSKGNEAASKCCGVARSAQDVTELLHGVEALNARTLSTESREVQHDGMVEYNKTLHILGIASDSTHLVYPWHGLDVAVRPDHHIAAQNNHQSPIAPVRRYPEESCTHLDYDKLKWRAHRESSSRSTHELRTNTVPHACFIKLGRRSEVDASAWKGRACLKSSGGSTPKRHRS